MKYEFRVINLTDGSQKDCSFESLSNSLFANCIILRVKEDGFESIGLVTHQTLVFFAVEFAHYALQNYAKKKSPKAEICISLVRKWIEDDTSVSNEELRAAAAYVAADAADYAAYVAADYAAYVAADAADAAYAAYAAADAAYAAANAAAYAADDAADAADAAGKDKEMEFIRQGEFILDFLKSGKHLFLV
jgi:hypothetical protein